MATNACATDLSVPGSLYVYRIHLAGFSTIWGDIESYGVWVIWLLVMADGTPGTHQQNETTLRMRISEFLQHFVVTVTRL